LTLSVVPIPSGKLTRAGFDGLPPAIARAGEKASWRFIEFFAANTRNKNTRAAYAHAVTEFFDCCESKHFKLSDLRPALIAGYIEQHPGSPPTVKQHLAAIRMLFDWLVIGQIVPMIRVSVQQTKMSQRFSFRRARQRWRSASPWRSM
jgi:site-specific recombinase XerD